ncbi:MAG: hypothetical protein EAZ09_14140 [Oscillatoriales cyanobacterium]|nr:MAG: hypothetical protein EAZ18_12160 [Oscillatoriales cyanobacterium]TAH20611.1 MAG: hypothetical protein EAZ09_14140 [Oscillatoriales cyanobacterium]
MPKIASPIANLIDRIQIPEKSSNWPRIPRFLPTRRLTDRTKSKIQHLKSQIDLTQITLK